LLLQRTTRDFFIKVRRMSFSNFTHLGVGIGNSNDLLKLIIFSSSKQLAPIYSKLAEKLKNNKKILIAKVDGTENQIPGITIEGFPTIKFFR